MASAKIRINPERSHVELIAPDGEVFSDRIPDDDDGVLSVLGDVTEDDTVYIAVVGSYDGLKDNTIYKLIEVPTILEENVLIEEDEDDEDEEETLPITSVK